MNHLNKKQDAHRRLARGSGAWLNSRRYMKSAEFKERQIWLDFKDAIGTAIEAVHEIIEAGRDWIKKWEREFLMPKAKVLNIKQMQLDYSLKACKVPTMRLISSL